MSAGVVPILAAARRRGELIRHLMRRKAIDASSAISKTECPNFDEFHSELAARKVLVFMETGLVYLNLAEFSDWEEKERQVGWENYLLFTACIVGVVLLMLYM